MATFRVLFFSVAGWNVIVSTEKFAAASTQSKYSVVTVQGVKEHRVREWVQVYWFCNLASASPPMT